MKGAGCRGQGVLQDLPQHPRREIERKTNHGTQSQIGHAGSLPARSVFQSAGHWMLQPQTHTVVLFPLMGASVLERHAPIISRHRVLVNEVNACMYTLHCSCSLQFSHTLVQEQGKRHISGTSPEDTMCIDRKYCCSMEQATGRMFFFCAEILLFDRTTISIDDRFVVWDKYDTFPPSTSHTHTHHIHAPQQQSGALTKKKGDGTVITFLISTIGAHKDTQKNGDQNWMTQTRQGGNWEAW